jgi:hypothetical protein
MVSLTMLFRWHHEFRGNRYCEARPSADKGEIQYKVGSYSQIVEIQKFKKVAPSFTKVEIIGCSICQLASRDKHAFQPESVNLLEVDTKPGGMADLKGSRSESVNVPIAV